MCFLKAKDSYRTHFLSSIGSELSSLRVLLGGSWVVISRVISRIAMVITYIRGLITPLRTTMNVQVTLPPRAFL